MTKRERAVLSIIIGGLAGGIILLELGLAHRPDVGAVLVSLAILGGCVVLTWWGLGRFEAA